MKNVTDSVHDVRYGDLSFASVTIILGENIESDVTGCTIFG